MTRQDLIAWLKNYLADLLGVASEEIGTDIPLEFLGVDSATALILSADLAAHGRQVRPAEIFDHPTLEALAHHLTESAASAGTAAETGAR